MSNSLRLIFSVASAIENSDKNIMKTSNYFFISFLILVSVGCTKTDDKQKEAGEITEFPNYKVINAPSRDPDKQWYVSDFFKRVEQWEPETTELGDLKHGMYELSQYPNQEPTQEQADAADKFIQDSLDVAKRNDWFRKEKGLSDGYEKMFGDPVHYVNKEYVYDGETLNPEKPEVLMYYKSSQGEFLMGIMFLAIGERGPQVAGPLSKWHYHIDRRMCYERGVLPIGGVDEQGACAVGIPNTRSPEMLHVWFFDHSDGRFATRMGLTEDQLNFGIRQVIDY